MGKERRSPRCAILGSEKPSTPVFRVAIALLLGAYLLSGCQPDYCEGLNSLECALPFPSDRYLVDDPTTVTGYRLQFDARAIPKNFLNQPFDTTPYDALDGVSPGIQILTLFSVPPDLDAAASQDTIGRSLDPDSPTVLIDMETGERVPHWTELDAQAESDDERLLYLRPAVRLQENRAYGVAIRGLTDINGDPLDVSRTFANLRDGLPTGSRNLEQRKARYENLFDVLETAGIARGSLQAAWWFHTASGDAIRGDLLAMREDALERLGDDGLECTITSVEENYKGQIWRYVKGTFTVPSYMDSPNPPARLVRGADGRPEFVEYVEVPFVADIPAVLAEDPDGPKAGPLLTFGHGLLGSAEGSIDGDDLREMANRFGVVIAGTDWAGMSDKDLLTLGSLLANGSLFPNMTDRLQQGMINQIALTRSLAGACRLLPELGAEGVPLIDPNALYYVGGSQGGILGGTLLTLSPDISKGVLFVGGASFPFMLDRSICFDPHLDIMRFAYPKRVDRAVIISASQLLWDASDPVSYLPFTLEGLEGIGPKQFLYIVAENDAQVPNLSSDLAMRTAGVPVVQGSVREPWGLDVVSAPFSGSGYISIDLGDPEVPYGNVAPSHDAGGHGAVPYTETSLQMTAEFLLGSGNVTMPCDGTCDPD